MIKLVNKQTMLLFECDMGRVVRRLGLIGGNRLHLARDCLVITAGVDSRLQAYQAGETIATGRVTKQGKCIAKVGHFVDERQGICSTD